MNEATTDQRQTTRCGWNWKRLLATGMLVSVVLLANCNSTQTNTGGQSTLDANVLDVANAQTARVNAVVTAVRSVAISAAGAIPTTRTADILANNEEAADCPAFSVSGQQGNTVVTLDYQTGCSQTLSGGAELSGQIEGVIHTDSQSISLVVTDVSNGNNTVSGSIDGQYARNEDTSIFVLDVDLVSDDVAFTGTVVVVIDELSGTVTIEEGTLRFEGDSAIPWFVTVEDVTLVTVDASVLLPFAGSATFDLPVAEGVGTRSSTLQFSEDTAADGNVSVAIAGVESIEFQLDF